MEENEKQEGLEEETKEGETHEEETDWKAEAEKYKGLANRYKTKLEKGKDATKQEHAPEQLNDFNEGQLAYLSSKGIELDEDIDFTLQELKKHGGTLRELLGNEYFTSTIKKRKDSKAVLDATPNTSRRQSNQSVDSVDYHLAKYLSTGKLPEDMEMSRKVVNARLKQEGNKQRFTDQKVIGV